MTRVCRWEGRVVEVEEEVFSAQLTPTDHDGPVMVADFQLDLLKAGLRPGDVFTLTTRRVPAGKHFDIVYSLRSEGEDPSDGWLDLEENDVTSWSKPEMVLVGVLIGIILTGLMAVFT